MIKAIKQKLERVTMITEYLKKKTYNFTDNNFEDNERQSSKILVNLQFLRFFPFLCMLSKITKVFIFRQKKSFGI